MQIYKITITKTAIDSLLTIGKHKQKYSNNSFYTEKFIDGFFTVVEKLNILPNRGTNLINDYQAIVYSEQIIIYKVIEPATVLIIDIIDPRQQTLANKYL